PPCTWVTKSIQKRDELSSQPLELCQLVWFEMPANLIQRARATGKQPLRLCHFALRGCDGGPIQAGPRIAISVPGTGRVPLQEPLPGLVDLAEVKLDPSEVVQLRRNPGQVSDLPVQVEAFQVPLARYGVVTEEPRAGREQMQWRRSCLAVAGARRAIHCVPRESNDPLMPAVSVGDSGQSWDRIALTAAVADLTSDLERLLVGRLGRYSSPSPQADEAYGQRTRAGRRAALLAAETA